VSPPDIHERLAAQVADRTGNGRAGGHLTHGIHAHVHVIHSLVAFSDGCRSKFPQQNLVKPARYPSNWLEL
jgi:hypothetical protein